MLGLPTARVSHWTQQAARQRLCSGHIHVGLGDHAVGSKKERWPTSYVTHLTDGARIYPAVGTD